MKKYIVFTFVLMLSFLFCSCVKKEKELNDLEVIKKRGYIIVGVKTDSPPFGYYDKNKKLVGIDIDIAKNIASEIFHETSDAYIKFVPVTPQNRISKLNTKEVDVLVATMSVNEKRKLVMNFSMPYFITSQKIMVKKTSQIPNLYYFNKNGRIALIMGTTGEHVVSVIAPNANIVGAKTYAEAFNYLKNSKVDAVLGDDCILAGFINKNYKIINRPYSKEFYAVAVRKSDKSKELLHTVNTAIAEVLDDKKLNYITKKWLTY